MTAEPVYRDIAKIEGHGFKPENIAQFEKAKEYLNKSVVPIIPTRGLIPMKVAMSWMGIAWPMNQPRLPFLGVENWEVGAAYEHLFELSLDKDMAEKALGTPHAVLLDKVKFILTLEEDNIIPPNAVNDLFEAIYTCIDCGKQLDLSDNGKPCKEKFEAWLCPDGHRGLDAVGGLYWTKGIPSRPMAYGDPKDEEVTFNPISVSDAIELGKVIEVRGVAMGCTLYRKGIFSKVSRPWFRTSNGSTQDLYFCEKAVKEAGARFAVHAGVRVGHHDQESGETF